MACLESALTYAKARPQFGRPIAGFQLTQAKFADMLTAITQVDGLGSRDLRAALEAWRDQPVLVVFEVLGGPSVRALAR